MKKSKIIGTILGSTALVGLAVATPIILTSCSSDTTNKLIKDSAITLSDEGKAKEGVSLERVKGTNDFKLNVGDSKIEINQLSLISFNVQMPNHLYTDEQLKELGFEKTTDLSLAYEILDNNGKETAIENEFKNLKNQKSLKLNAKWTIMDATSATDIKHQVSVLTSLTLIANK